MKKLRKKLAAAVELPESAFGSCPYLTIESNTSVKIDECCEILSYDTDAICLRLRGLTVTVTGRWLTMRSYAMKTVRIVGRIDGVSLAEEREGKD
jgi:hypothetical protein